MMLEKLSQHIAIKIKHYDPDGPGSVETLQYGIGLKLNLYAGVMITILLGALFSTVLGALTALIAFIALRRFSGGVHLPITICSIVTGLGAGIVPLISLSETYRLILDVLTILILIMFAPNNFEILYREQKENILLTKTIAIGLVLINLLWIKSPTITLAFIIQAVLILPIYSRRGGEFS